LRAFIETENAALARGDLGEAMPPYVPPIPTRRRCFNYECKDA
jgi:hypothetical protein